MVKWSKTSPFHGGNPSSNLGRVTTESNRIIAVILKNGSIAQLVRAPALQAGGHRFESCYFHQRSPKQIASGFSIEKLITTKYCFCNSQQLAEFTVELIRKTIYMSLVYHYKIIFVAAIVSDKVCGGIYCQ